MTEPFQYPATILVRRHGPRGYKSPAGFLPWLRDEFGFRCVYCLKRETWQDRDHEVEHFEAASLAPHRRLDYSNHYYACRTCNGAQHSSRIPNPGDTLLHDAVRVETDGTLIPLTAEAAVIIKVLGLNAKRHREFRGTWMRIIAVIRVHDPKLYHELMGFPKQLPNLRRLRPPGGNDKLEGVETAFHERRLRGELPEVY
jgi:hypothetical protein